MSIEHDVDVAIVGGGLAGASLALALARGGLSCCLLDSKPVEVRTAPEFDGRAYALAAASINLLRGIGIWPAVADMAQPMDAIEIYDGQVGRPGAVRLRFDGAELDRSPFAVLLEDRHLRRALIEAIEAAPLVTHRAPVTVRGYDPTGNGAMVHTDDAAAVKAAVVVAADGRRSGLASAAGIRWHAHAYGQTGLVCAIDLAEDHGGVARQVFYPGGPFAVLPLTGRRASIVWSERDAIAREISALDDAAYLAEIRRRLGHLGNALSLAGKRYAFPLSLGLAYDFAAPRLALLGDAAHAMHPIAGQGFNIGLRDAATLAEVLVDARRRGEDIGASMVLQRYTRWRRADSVAMVAATDNLNRLFSNDGNLRRFVRDTGLRFVNGMPSVKRAIMASAAGLDGDLPRLLQGQAI